ncbi:MAG: hypothetical protein GX564_14150, partial [Oligosphaeraceae bacterium]|nr:hypothetical protein [Oligosphaeraceae bacterium]
MRDPKFAFSQVESLDWSAVRCYGGREYPSAYSLRVPLQFPESDRLILCDPALNLSVLPVPPDLRTHDAETAARLKRIISLVSSFALEDPPWVPEFRRTELQRHPEGLPIITMRYFCRDLLYEFTYATDKNGFIHIAVRVENQHWEAQSPTLRWKVFFGSEGDLFDYHYVPFDWTARRWRPENAVSYRPETQQLCWKGTPFARVSAGAYRLEWQEKCQFPAEIYNQKFNCSAPYYVQPEMQLRSCGQLLQFQTALAPGESQSFNLILSSDFSTPVITPRLSAKKRFLIIQKQWREELHQHLTSDIDFGDERENQVLCSLFLTNRQYLLKLQSATFGTVVQPCQGSSSERFYVWVWEAMCMLLAHLQLGDFKTVRKVLGFIFLLQDGGCPPQGEFTQLQGAIGTTGPRWANSTGAALLLAADYLLLSQDNAFRRQYLPKMLRAAHWIISQQQATDCPGVPELQRGLFPPAWATDGDYGLIYTATDIWSCAGLSRLAGLLQQLGHSASGEISRAAEQYRQNLRRTMQALQQENGYIPRKLSDAGRLAPKFENLTTVIRCIPAGIFTAQEAFLQKYVSYCEEMLFRYPFLVMMDYEVAYIGNNELAYQQYYLQRGEWKKAWLAFRSFWLYGMTEDLFLTQERYSTLNPAFAPWQPNSSNNG